MKTYFAPCWLQEDGSVYAIDRAVLGPEWTPTRDYGRTTGRRRGDLLALAEVADLRFVIRIHRRWKWTGRRWDVHTHCPSCHPRWWWEMARPQGFPFMGKNLECVAREGLTLSPLGDAV